MRLVPAAFIGRPTCTPRRPVNGKRRRRWSVQHSMGEEKPHVAPIELWGYTSGTANLTDEDFEHLLFCVECQSLVNQFIDVLDQLPSSKPSPAA